VCFAGLHLKDLPKQVLIRGNPQEGLAHDDEAHQLQQCIGREVMQLDSVLTKETAEDVRSWDPEPAFMEVGERHHFTMLWERLRLAGGALHPAVSFGRRRPFAMKCCNLASVTDEGIHSPISNCR
jgi:hypothetical protein